MLRVANVVMVMALLATAAVVYQLKYASTADAERLASLRSAIRKERDAIAVMNAEWARRTSPLYIQGLVERHLDLKPLEVEAMSTLDDLPEKPAGKSDGIGGMIEALVDAPLVTSSAGRPEKDTGAGTSAPPAASALRSSDPKPKKPPQPKPVASRAPPRPNPAPLPESVDTPSEPMQSEPEPQQQEPFNPLAKLFPPDWFRPKQ